MGGVCSGGVILQFSFRAAKVERSLSHLVPLEQSLFKCVVTETALGAAGASELPTQET